MASTVLLPSREGSAGSTLPKTGSGGATTRIRSRCSEEALAPDPRNHTSVDSRSASCLPSGAQHGEVSDTDPHFALAPAISPPQLPTTHKPPPLLPFFTTSLLIRPHSHIGPRKREHNNTVCPPLHPRRGGWGRKNNQ